MKRLTNAWSARVVAVGVACAVAFAGPGVVAAEAVQVAGQQSTGAERTSATDTVTIRLTQGNPNDDGQPPSGKIQGVTIHLDRLAGLDPTNADDAARVRNANLDEVRDWRTDVHVDLVTNANGEVTFDGLAHGFYVVTSTAPDDSYREINPFVVAVPFHTVVDNPKPVPGVIVAKTHKPGETPTPPTSSSAPSAPPSRPDTPQTPPNYPPTKPGKPPHQPETTPPGTPSAGKTSTPVTSSGNGGSLAMTGAQVIGVVAAALALIATGFVMIAFSRRKNSESEGR
ncbi:MULTISPECIES: SpaA isopeptide-forming pilin-related protein [Corynebacterium]|uniref:Prealbumin-like fold domain-containing protein n=2 Tax=Corynebacterium tuberculostearicum TaxID=38304 RepID=A0A7Y9ZWV1_9CORY|nr:MULTISPECIES: SpaA isopeptide-forming pilin-related protein [Corynebacterium]MBK3427759.1 prealbumin-like fold domain-containing protein [Corynebacterium tuberculostearicum]MBS5996690.1 prealbumin-like fold domain-containing protein [Corynebacterium sp.]MCG7462691.1 prealbumin-like fold domain-containing protein [Corynebacterium tuberculostearicum]MDK8670586.1 SpaA isopeptide-forming pilin-related protein [Corynebacterium sp. MSK195]MDU1461191.1 SpaA isopeptide-forming pilin-related protein